MATAPIEELHFLHPETREGLNVTVRLGNKWYRQVNVGGKVRILSCGVNHPKDCQPLKLGSIVFRFLTPFNNLIRIPHILDYEHDPTCRESEGLEKAMRQAYSTFAPYMDVTVLGFTVDNL